MITVGLILIFAALVLAFEAGRQHGTDAEQWRQQAAAQLEVVAMAPSRTRHPTTSAGISEVRS